MATETKRRKQGNAGPAIHPELAGSEPELALTVCKHCGLLMWRGLEEAEPDACRRCGEAPGGDEA